MDGGVERAPIRQRLAPHLLLVAFSAGTALALAVAPGAVAGPVGAAGVCVVGAAARAAVARRRAGTALLLLAVVIAGAGWLWGGARLQATAPATLELPARVAGTVAVDTPAVPDGFGGWRMRAVAQDLTRDGSGAPVPAGTRLLLTLRHGEPPPAGTRLRVAGELRAAATRHSPSWWRAWLERQGVAARLAPRAARAMGSRGGASGMRDRWRNWATEHVAAGLHGDVAALVRGMALGGGALLSQEAATAFREAGIWHLLAVSGQNVTVVALAALACLLALGARRRPAVAASGALLVAYCLACDGGASVARAGTVGALALVGELRSAPRERWALLLAGLALLLAWQPRALGDPGLQLSFAAVAGILVLSPVLGRWARGWLPGPVADLAGVAAAAGLATAPVVALHFGRVSLVGFALNVVAVPLAAPVVVLALVGIVADALLPSVGVLASWPAGAGAWVLLALARVAAAVPGATVAVPGWAVPPLAVLAVAPALAGAWLARAPEDGPTPRAVARGALAAVLVVVGAWALWPRAPVMPWPDGPALTALDVGQGDAILLRDAAGAAVLVDAGPQGDPPAVLAALRRHGVGRLDALVITHGDADHAGGAAAVLRSVDVGVVLHPPRPADGWSDAMSATLDAAGGDVPTVEVRGGARVTASTWTFAVLWPQDPLAPGGEPNEGSVVMRAQAPGLRALLTGDAESPVLAGLGLGAVDVLKVAHHGSADDGLARLLARTRPRAAVISVGEGNTFGHPRPEILRALTAAGVRVWRTDRDGDITLGPRDVAAAAPAP